MQNLESLAEKLREGFVSDDVKLATDGIHRILVGYQMATIRRLDAAYAEVQNNGLKRTRDHTSPEQAWDCKTQVEVENSRHELTRDVARLENLLLTKKTLLSKLPPPLPSKEPESWYPDWISKIMVQSMKSVKNKKLYLTIALRALGHAQLREQSVRTRVERVRSVGLLRPVRHEQAQELVVSELGRYLGRRHDYTAHIDCKHCTQMLLIEFHVYLINN
jgi:hypothetical protein